MRRILIAALLAFFALPVAAGQLLTAGQVNGSGSPITVGTTTINGGTNGRCLYDNNGVVGEQACGGSSGITVGTTTVTGGVTQQLLFNSAGVVGEITKCNSGVYLTSAGGVPSCGATLPNINLGTPTALVGTNISGTAASFTAGHVTGLTVTSGKTLTVLKTISLTAADDTGVYTLPTGTKTLVATDVVTLSSLTTAADGVFKSGAFAFAYVLPDASTTTLGGVIVDGTTITISGGVISASGGAPAGPVGSVQFNNTVFAGDSGFLYAGAGVATLDLGVVTTNKTALTITAVAGDNVSTISGLKVFVDDTNFTSDPASSRFIDFSIASSGTKFSVDLDGTVRATTLLVSSVFQASQGQFTVLAVNDNNAVPTQTLASYISAGEMWLGTVTNDKLSFYVNNGGESLTIDTTGNVGLGGVVTPGQMLTLPTSGLLAWDNGSGVTDATTPALAKNGTTLRVRLGDNSAFTNIEAKYTTVDDTTGAGTVLGFGANSPAGTLTGPYTWLRFTSGDGSTVYVPGYK